MLPSALSRCGMSLSERSIQSRVGYSSLAMYGLWGLPDICFQNEVTQKIWKEII